ncbi:amidase domain-containing protein [Oscillospiraceae bacterium CM]|nr:amidase domain-containing protein [Oscillospiraceae bacterium CM]
MGNGSASYDRLRAVGYAHTWAYGRNPMYYNYENIGGDCTNFVSQCLFAGAQVMNHARNGWYYYDANNKSASWSGVEFLYEFLVGNSGLGPFAALSSAEDILPGDIIQMSFNGQYFQHSLFVVDTGRGAGKKTIQVATHTDDTDHNPLETYTYEKIRFLHILGVRL